MAACRLIKSKRREVVFNYDILVIGAGHAGCEAAAAAANMGKRTCLMTIDMNKIAQMSCNPAIGGIAKGQIVREIDALGGYTGIVTDKASIQFRMLNRSKGPAMWSPRAQCDRMKFSQYWREILENTPKLEMWQDIATELIVENGKAAGFADERNGILWRDIIAGNIIRAIQSDKTLEGIRCAFGVAACDQRIGEMHSADAGCIRILQKLCFGHGIAVSAQTLKHGSVSCNAVVTCQLKG